MPGSRSPTCSRRQLRHREVGWGADRGERPVRTKGTRFGRGSRRACGARVKPGPVKAGVSRGRGSVQPTTGGSQVLGDGMVRKAERVKQGDLRGRGEARRSQSTHSS
jgi:hypothetical protein